MEYKDQIAQKRDIIDTEVGRFSFQCEIQVCNCYQWRCPLSQVQWPSWNWFDPFFITQCTNFVILSQMGSTFLLQWLIGIPTWWPTHPSSKSSSVTNQFITTNQTNAIRTTFLFLWYRTRFLLNHFYCNIIRLHLLSF